MSRPYLDSRNSQFGPKKNQELKEAQKLKDLSFILRPKTVFENYPGPKSKNYYKIKTYQMSELKETWKWKLLHHMSRPQNNF